MRMLFPSLDTSGLSSLSLPLLSYESQLNSDTGDGGDLDDIDDTHNNDFLGDDGVFEQYAST